MKDFSLDNCTKEQLTNKINRYIGFMYSKRFLGNVYITLDDKFTENPTIHFQKNNDAGSNFGILEICGYSKVTRVINNVWEEYCPGIYDTLEGFIDDLYDYIQRYY